MESIQRPRLALVALAAAVTLSTPRSAPAAPPEPHAHKLCAWIYEHEDAAETERAYDTFAAHADDLDAVHPKWWRVASPSTFANHPIDRAEPFRGFHDRRVLDHTTRGGARTRLMPLVGATSPSDAGAAYRMIHDPALRAEHVAGLVRIAVDNGYDGLDLDYEHLLRDRDRSRSLAEERAAFSAFVEAAAHALHARGKELSLAIPVTFSNRSEFDLDALSAAADELHVMGYDLHYEGGNHAGPGAPLGWIQRYVDELATIDGGRRTSRFILGLPNYGVLGAPGAEVEACEPLARCFELFDGDYATTTDELDHCPDDAGEAPGRAPNVLLPNGKRLFFEDLASLEEKVAAARAGGLGGISEWGIGGEASRPGARSFFQMVRSHFPR